MAKVKFSGLNMDSVGALIAEGPVVTSLLDLDAAYLDFDSTGIGYARVGAKRNGAGTSGGLKLRTLNAGTAVDAVIFAADGTPTFAKAIAAVNLGKGVVVLANGATVNGPDGRSVLFAVRDITVGGSAVVACENGGTPGIIWQDGTHYTVSAPSSSQVQILARVAGSGVKFTAGSAVACSLQYSSLVAQEP